MSDNDLRFGDIGDGSGSNDGMVDLFINIFKLLILIYVILKVVEILYNIPIPLI